MNALIYHNQSVRLAATTARASVRLTSFPPDPSYFSMHWYSIRIGLKTFTESHIRPVLQNKITHQLNWHQMSLKKL